MKFKLRYGSSCLDIFFDDLTAVECLEIGDSSIENGNVSRLVRKSILEADVSLSDFLKPGLTLAIIVSDQTRPTGSEQYLPILIEESRLCGVEEITVILSQGLHRPATAAEIDKICGGKLPDGVNVINHDAENNLKKCGDAFFRAEAVDADRVIITGAVTFHPMAGFSGGRKSLLPGIASADDIRKNHRLYFSSKERNSACGPALVSNNPVRDDLTSRTQGFKNLWALNVVMDEHKNIVFVSSGNADKVWTDCSRWVSDNNSIRISEDFDTVISSAGGYPSDFSFYQSMKVLTNSARACKEGGRMFILSECSNGWEIDTEMMSLFSLSVSEVIECLLDDFRMDVLGIYMAMSIIRSYEVWIYSSLPRNEVEAAGMHYLDDISMIKEIVKDGSVAVIKNGSSILPINDERSKELL